jgi:hypothetical protein
MRALAFAPCVIVLSACSGESPAGSDADAPWVDIGLSAGVGGLDFEPLELGGQVPLATFGQGGTHALLAVRCSGFGDAAFVNVDITNLNTGVQVSSTPTSSPQLLLCRDELLCDLVPLLVMMGGLTAPGEEREGLPIRVEVEAHNVAGTRAEVEREAILSARSLSELL